MAPVEAVQRSAVRTIGLPVEGGGAALRRGRRRGVPKRLGIIGDREAIRRTAEALFGGGLPDYVLTATCILPEDGRREGRGRGGSGVDGASDVMAMLGSETLDVVALDTISNPLDDAANQRLIELCFEGVEVRDLVGFLEGIHGRHPSHALEGRRILSAVAVGSRNRRLHGWIKRGIDVVASGVALLVAAVPMLTIALLIKLDGSGPVMFVQERLGRRRRPFACLKFRTMLPDAEHATGPVWACEADPRVTRVGRWLRKSRLDELPQLINVLRGEMSLVGPRPIRAHFADLLEEQIPFYNLRFTVMPGLTGWAQVNHPYAASVADQAVKFHYDLFYLEKRTLWLDFVILLKTVAVMARGGGL